MRILTLEDEAIIAASLYELLHLLDYDPYQPVDNPDDAIKIIKRFPPDLFILDLDLKQKKAGLEVVDYIDKHKLNIPFIVLAADGSAKTIASVKRYRPSAYLIKPFTPEALFAAIELLPEREQAAGIEELPEHGLFIKTGSRYEKLDLAELLYVKASGKYIELNFKFGKRLIRTSLRTFIEKNTHIKFLRTHKSYAVNPEFITSFTAEELSLGSIRIPIGRFFMSDTYGFLRSQSLKKRRAGH